MNPALRPINERELGVRVGMELGHPGFMAVVADADEEAARRIATRLGYRAELFTTSGDPRTLADGLRDRSADPMVVAGLDRLSEASWKKLDRWRDQLRSEHLRVLVMSEPSAERLARYAPNLASLFAAEFFRWKDEPEAAAEPAAEADAQAKFEQLAARWEKETRALSSASLLVAHPAYQEIIAMGESAILPLLRELAREPNLWGPALHAITGARPVRPEHAGKTRLVAADWLSWAKENGYVW